MKTEVLIFEIIIEILRKVDTQNKFNAVVSKMIVRTTIIKKKNDAGIKFIIWSLFKLYVR